MTLLNETDILSQYLEKEVRRRCWEKREGAGRKSDWDEVELDRLPVSGTPGKPHASCL